MYPQNNRAFVVGHRAETLHHKRGVAKVQRGRRACVTLAHRPMVVIGEGRDHRNLCWILATSPTTDNPHQTMSHSPKGQALKWSLGVSGNRTAHRSRSSFTRHAAEGGTRAILASATKAGNLISPMCTIPEFDVPASSAGLTSMDFRPCWMSARAWREGSEAIRTCTGGYTPIAGILMSHHQGGLDRRMARNKLRIRITYGIPCPAPESKIHLHSFLSVDGMPGE